LHLHPALGADQLVPLVDHHQRDRRQLLAAVGARQHQADALRRRDQHFRQLPRLPRALAGLGVAGAHAHRPGEPEIRKRFAQRARGVCRECPHRRNPQQAQTAAHNVAGQRSIEQAEPDGVGLARAGGGVQKPRAAGCDVFPHLTLEGERCPAMRGEPALGAGQRQLRRLGAAAGGSCRRAGLRLAFGARAPRANRTQLRTDVGARRKTTHGTALLVRRSIVPEQRATAHRCDAHAVCCCAAAKRVAMSENIHLWRICADKTDCAATDLSGRDAAEESGRWNAPGVPMVYAARSRSLACLESLAHLDLSQGLPEDRWLIQITVPRALWDARRPLRRERSRSSRLGRPARRPGFDQLGHALGASRRLAGRRSASVIVPEEINVLLNPAHSQLEQVRARRLRRWHYDLRLT
jgi:RES domain-containing protein